MSYGHPPLVQPQFNKYLTSGEVSLLEWETDRSWPLGCYYFYTRGMKNTRNDKAVYNQANTAGPWHFGPLCAWTWGLDA